MRESDCNEEESSLEEEGDTSPRKPRNTGARLWDRVRSRLLRQKVKIWVTSKEKIISAFVVIYVLHKIFPVFIPQ